jgi:adenylate cyclase
MYGEFIPLGGGDPIPLMKKTLLVGRRESCDIVLRFPNVSAHHCQLQINNGYWYVTDLNSRNGVKVNNMRVTEKRLDPGDTISIAKHKYEVRYSPADLGAVGPPPSDGEAQMIFGSSLLERAGLSRRKVESIDDNDPDHRRRREITKDDPTPLRKKDPNRPV